MTRITPIRFTRNVGELTAFYALLGLTEKTTETSRTWSSLAGSGGGLGIHIIEQPTTEADPRSVSLQLTTDDTDLDTLHERLSANGHEPGPIMDETFGRFFTVADPDGYLVHVNETPDEFSRSYETRDSAALL